MMTEHRHSKSRTLLLSFVCHPIIHVHEYSHIVSTGRDKQTLCNQDVKMLDLYKISYISAIIDNQLYFIHIVQIGAFTVYQRTRVISRTLISKMVECACDKGELVDSVQSTDRSKSFFIMNRKA